MTRYIDTRDIRSIVNRVGIANFIGELADYIESDYRRWESFEKCARVANHSSDGVIELMPTSDEQYYGFKYVNGHPKNTRDNLLTVMAFGALAEVSTGSPLLLSELTITTALRTAATSALFASVLARPDSRSMAIIGNGAQSEFQILAFNRLLGISQFYLYDIDAAATRKLQQNLEGLAGVSLTACASSQEACREADIITTVTADKNYATILTPDMVRPGVHINAVGGDCPGKTELHAGILRMARVFVEFEPQTRIEGDIQQMPADFPVTEFWQVLNGQKPGRENDGDITVFDSVGFALEDFSALRYVLDKATDLNIGQDIDLIPHPENPKNLFALLA
ncbi:ornithine cyclodeaminase [Vogesella sp. LIG4]|uniref:ornithine cyclodeaminase n=1 Tax=Vogesella sp. LIG4 TaxID=1192162 RepID=UPI00081FF898|nr:ornithine cyclodeaminase [Vogesella sp. LIG4]SCK28244.1 ornithine cyclodeaminase [Vogesella sp. LIG4]